MLETAMSWKKNTMLLLPCSDAVESLLPAIPSPNPEYRMCLPDQDVSSRASEATRLSPHVRTAAETDNALLVQE
jgi:hypothetical protein